MFVVLLAASCGSKPAASPDMRIVDVTMLRDVSEPASRDLDHLIRARLPLISRCADLVRPLVRQSDPGFGHVGIVMEMIGATGRALEIQPVRVDRRMPQEFDLCVMSALRWPAHVVSSGDYALTVRWYICIDPIAGPEAS